MTPLVVTMTATSRPTYLREVLESLRRCDGIDDAVLLPHVEPGNDEVRALIAAVDFCPCEPTWNDTKVGVNLNTYRALSDGFARSDYVVHVEDDVCLAPDALTFFRWAGEAYRGIRDVLSVTGYNRLEAAPLAVDGHRVETRAWFHPWSVATWRNQWATYLQYARLWRERLTFDCGTLALAQLYGLREAYPILSRVQNVGESSSIYPPDRAPSAEFYRANHRVKFWAGNTPPGPGAFHEEKRAA